MKIQLVGEGKCAERETSLSSWSLVLGTLSTVLSSCLLSSVLNSTVL